MHARLTSPSTLFAALLFCTTARAELVPPSASRAFTVELRGAWSIAATRHEWFSMLTLTIPLGRATGSFALTPLAEAGSVVPEAEAPAPSRSEAPRRLEAVRFRPVLSRGLMRATLRAALRAAGFRAGERRLDSLSDRARASAALPELRLRGARGIDYSRKLSPTTTDPYKYSEEGAADLLLEARLAWKLDRLLFADEEIAIERLRGDRAAARQKLVARVLEALFRWERARLARADPELSPAERDLAELRINEAELWLDVLTGGAFSDLAGIAP
jgi:hypothetical protein